MKFRTTLALFLFAATVAAQSPPAEQPAPADRPQDLASLLPEKTLFLLETDDLGGSGAWSREMAVGRLFAEPEMQAFLRPFVKNVKRALENYPAVAFPLAIAGVQVDDLLKIRIQRFGLAVVHEDQGIPRIPDTVLTVQFRAGAATVQKMMTKLRGMAGNFGVDITTERIRDREVWTVAMGPMEIYGTFTANRFLLTTRKPRMTQLLTALDEGQPKPLAATARFKDMVDRLKAPKRALTLFVNVGHGIEFVRGLQAAGMIDDAEVVAVLDTLKEFGLDAVESLVFVSVREGDQHRGELAATLSARRGLLGTLPTGKPDHRFAKYVPADAMLYGTNETDLGAFVKRIFAWAEGGKTRVLQRIASGLRDLKPYLESEIAQDLFAAAGTQWGYYLGKPPQAGLVPDFVVFAELKDPERFDKGMRALLTWARREMVRGRGSMLRRKTTFRGHTIHFLELSARRDPIPVAPSWCVHEGTVMFALYPQALKHALMKKASLADSAAFKTQLRKVPAGAMAVTYMDTGRLTTWAYNTLVPVAQAMQGYMNRNLENFGFEVNFQDLPAADIFQKHIGPTVSYIVVDDGAIRMGAVSPYRVEMLTAVALGVVGAAYYTYMEEQEAQIRRARWEWEQRRKLQERIKKLEAENKALRGAGGQEPGGEK